MNWRKWALMTVGAVLLVAVGAFVVGPLLQGERERVPFVDGPRGEGVGEGPGPGLDRPPGSRGMPPEGPAEGRPDLAPPRGAREAGDFEPGTPERVAVMSEVPDTVPVGLELPTSIAFRVGDERNLPVPETSVAFSVLEGDGHLEASEATTDEVGIARLRYTPESEGRHLLEVLLHATGDTALASFHAVP